MKRDFFKIILTIVIGAIIGTLLLLISYSLPAKKIEKNINKSIDIFVNEDKYEKIIYKYKNTRLDNFTDAIMLQSAGYTGEGSIVSKTMNVYRFQNDEDPCQSLILQMQGQKNNISAYDRYWHGYLIILKPLLLFFSYNDIRAINTVLQPIIVFAVIIFMVKSGKKIFVIPYFISVLLISPMTISQSLQYSTIFYIFNLSMLIMLIYNDKLKEKNRYTFFFLILGMVTSYFDFLTYPLVTLGMPLILYIILNPNNKVVDSIKIIINKSLIWGIGYIGMWSGKIIIGSILLNRNLFSSALNKVAERTSLEVYSNNVSIISIFKRNISMYINKPYLLLALCVLIYIIYRIIKIKYKPNKKDFMNFIPYFIISMMPFAWYIVAGNHSYIHSWFTHKVLIITIFSLLSYISGILCNYGGEK